MKTIFDYRIVFLFLFIAYFNIAKAETNRKTESIKYSRGALVNNTYFSLHNSKDADRDIFALLLNSEIGYYFRWGVSVNSNGYLFYANGRRIPDDQTPVVELDADVFGAGGGGFLRWDFLRFRGSSLFVDYGVGMVFTNKTFPPGGTAWNFTKRTGIGVSIRLNKRLNLVAGWRNMHISNGKGFGHPKNPAFDSKGIYLGVRY